MKHDHALGWPPRLKSGRQRSIIQIVEFAANGHTVGQPRCFRARFRKAIGQIMGSGLTVDCCVHGQDDFLDAALADASHQGIDVEIVGSDTV